MRLRQLFKYCMGLTGAFMLVAPSASRNLAAAAKPAVKQPIEMPPVENDTIKPFQLFGADKLEKDPDAESIALKNGKYGSIVVDAETGEILSGTNIDKKLHPASTTKLLTAYLVFEALENNKLTLDQKLPVSYRAAIIEPSDMDLVSGGQVSVKDALQGILIESANDAAIVLGTAIGGTEAGFVAKMNEKAKQLGMKNSHFVNTNGLPYDLKNGPKTKAKSPQSKTTVADMSLLMHAIIKDYPQYYHYLSQTSFAYKGVTFRTHNKMIIPGEAQYYQYIDGGKTGYVQLAGCNLVCSAVKDGKRVIGVVFGMPSGATRAAEMKRILENGFATLQLRNIAPHPETPGLFKWPVNDTIVLPPVFGPRPF